MPHLSDEVNAMLSFPPPLFSPPVQADPPVLPSVSHARTPGSWDLTVHGSDVHRVTRVTPKHFRVLRIVQLSQLVLDIGWTAGSGRKV